jgi:hypothetical protein
MLSAILHISKHVWFKFYLFLKFLCFLYFGLFFKAAYLLSVVGVPVVVGVPQFENRAIYRAEAKNEGRYTSAPLVRLCGGENYIFTLLPLQYSASLIETFILLSSVPNTDTENIF